MKARVRIQRVVEKWFLAEPALFGAWTTHALAVAPGVRNIRVQHGRIEYNPDFVLALNPADLDFAALEASRAVAEVANDRDWASQYFPTIQRARLEAGPDAEVKRVA